MSFPYFQPSVYLRLLENPSSVTQQTTFLYSPNPSHAYSRSPSPSRSKSPSRSPSPDVTGRRYRERASPDLITGHFSRPGSEEEEEVRQVKSMQCDRSYSMWQGNLNKHDTIFKNELIMKTNLLPSLQSKAEKLSTREFSKRSIKDRAVLLSSLFPGSKKPPLSPLSEAQVRLFKGLWHAYDHRRRNVHLTLELRAIFFIISFHLFRFYLHLMRGLLTGVICTVCWLIFTDIVSSVCLTILYV